MNIFIIHIGSCYIAYVVKRILRNARDSRYDRWGSRVFICCVPRMHDAPPPRDEKKSIIMLVRSSFSSIGGGRGGENFLGKQENRKPAAISFIFSRLRPSLFLLSLSRAQKRERSSPSFSLTLDIGASVPLGNAKRSRMEFDQPRINSSTAA